MRDHQMEKKAKDLIYLDPDRYLSIQSIRVFYWGILIIPFIMLMVGLGGKITFSTVFIGIWSLVWWVMVLLLQSKKIKKTFALRFLVNGIAGVMISALFWGLYSTVCLLSSDSFFTFDSCLWILLFYLLFSAIYVALILLGVHRGVFEKLRKMGKSPKIILLDAFFASLIPTAGVAGMYTSKMLRAHASPEAQEIAMNLAFLLVFFLPALAHINFVMYYYCKKYKITCDEFGNSTSPALELEKRPKRKKRKKQEHEEDTATPKPLGKRILKGIGILLSIPVAIFLFLLILGFILSLQK